jgi:hypothetical protein
MLIMKNPPHGSAGLWGKLEACEIALLILYDTSRLFAQALFHFPD